MHGACPLCANCVPIACNHICMLLACLCTQSTCSLHASGTLLGWLHAFIQSEFPSHATCMLMKPAIRVCIQTLQNSGACNNNGACILSMHGHYRACFYQLECVFWTYHFWSCTEHAIWLRILGVSWEYAWSMYFDLLFCCARHRACNLTGKISVQLSLFIGSPQPLWLVNSRRSIWNWLCECIIVKYTYTL